MMCITLALVPPKKFMLQLGYHFINSYLVRCKHSNWRAGLGEHHFLLMYGLTCADSWDSSATLTGGWHSYNAALQFAGLVRWMVRRRVSMRTWARRRWRRSRRRRVRGTTRSSGSACPEGWRCRTTGSAGTEERNRSLLAFLHLTWNFLCSFQTCLISLKLVKLILISPHLNSVVKKINPIPIERKLFHYGRGAQLDRHWLNDLGNGNVALLALDQIQKVKRRFIFVPDRQRCRPHPLRRRRGRGTTLERRWRRQRREDIDSMWGSFSGKGRVHLY